MMNGFRVMGVGFVTLASVSSADVLHLKLGGRLEGVLTVETATSLSIDVGMGQVSVPRSSVARVERRESTVSEYRRRLASIAWDDVKSLTDLARFASDSSLRTESQKMWGRVLSLDPKNVEAHLALGHVLVGGSYLDEAEAARANGLVNFGGRWMSRAEEASLLREREQRSADERRVESARRTAREAEDRARRAEADAAEARAARSWGYGSTIGFWPGNRYRGGCSHLPCTSWPLVSTTSAEPAPTPRPHAVPVRPSSLH